MQFKYKKLHEDSRKRANPSQNTTNWNKIPQNFPTYANMKITFQVCFCLVEDKSQGMQNTFFIWGWMKNPKLQELFLQPYLANGREK